MSLIIFLLALCPELHQVHSDKYSERAKAWRTVEKKGVVATPLLYLYQFSRSEDVGQNARRVMSNNTAFISGSKAARSIKLFLFVFVDGDEQKPTGVQVDLLYDNVDLLPYVSPLSRFFCPLTQKERGQKGLWPWEFPPEVFLKMPRNLVVLCVESARYRYTDGVEFLEESGY